MNTTDAAYGRGLALFYAAIALALLAIFYPQTPFQSIDDAAPATHVVQADRATLGGHVQLQGGLKVYFKSRPLASAR